MIRVSDFAFAMNPNLQLTNNFFLEGGGGGLE